MPERQLPHNTDAEKATLGSILLDRDAITPIAAWLRPEHFYSEKHAWIFAAMLDCVNKRIPPDLTTVLDVLRKQERLDQVGGLPYLTDLSNAVPVAFHVEYYARIVEKTATLRKLITVGGQIVALGYNEVEELDDVLSQADQALGRVLDRSSLKQYAPLSDVVDDYYAYLERLQAGDRSVVGLPTGFVDYDTMTGGLHKSDLLILAARPGVGKSAFSLTIAFNIAMHQHTPVGVFALEMGREQLLWRILAQHTGIDSQRIQNGKLSTAELTMLMEAMAEVSALPIHIDDTPGLSVIDLRARARRMVAEQGIEVLIVDYLQLMSGSSSRRENRTQEVSEISRAMKQLAREFNIPIIALSQLSRAVEGRTSHVPVLADLRESGSLEQDADQVMLIYRPEMYDPDTDQAGIAQIHIAKNRNGPLGVVPLFFDKRTTKFTNLAAYASPEGY